MALIVKLLKDGSGRVCIHWFARDKAGPIAEPNREPAVPAWAKGTAGRIACQPKRTSLLPESDQNGNGIACMHTDDPRAATCPECLATAEYKTIMAELALIVPTPTQ